MIFGEGAGRIKESTLCVGEGGKERHSKKMETTRLKKQLQAYREELDDWRYSATSRNNVVRDNAKKEIKIVLGKIAEVKKRIKAAAAPPQPVVEITPPPVSPLPSQEQPSLSPREDDGGQEFMAVSPRRSRSPSAEQRATTVVPRPLPPKEKEEMDDEPVIWRVPVDGDTPILTPEASDDDDEDEERLVFPENSTPQRRDIVTMVVTSPISKSEQVILKLGDERRFVTITAPSSENGAFEYFKAEFKRWLDNNWFTEHDQAPSAAQVFQDFIVADQGFLFIYEDDDALARAWKTYFAVLDDEPGMVAVVTLPQQQPEEVPLTSDQALDRLIDILSRYEPYNITKEERHYLKRVRPTYFQALLDRDLEDRASELDPDLQNPKWALARAAARKWLNYPEASRLVREWFKQMYMAARLQAALMINGLKVNRARENAKLNQLRRAMITIHMDERPVYPDEIAEVVPVTDDPEKNLAVWKYFFGDINTRLEQRKRAPAFPKIKDESDLEADIVQSEKIIRAQQDSLDDLDRKAPLSLEQMRERYVRKDWQQKVLPGMLRKDSSEKTIRAHHAKIIGERRKLMVDTIESYTNRSAKLRAELERVRQKKRSLLPAAVSPRRSSVAEEEDDDDFSLLRSKKSAPRSRSPSPELPLRRYESSDDSSLLRVLGGKSTTTTKKRAVSPPPLFKNRPKIEPENVWKRQSPAKLLFLSDDDEPVVVIQKPPPPKEKEEERPRKKTSGATRVMNILAKQTSIVKRLIRYLNMSEDEATILSNQLETWLVNEWFSREKRSPSAETVIDRFFVGELGELATPKNERRWKRFLKPLDESTNKFLEAPLLDALGCAFCSTPTPRYNCGAGCKMRYCGQDCADAHWAEHNCRN